MNRFSIWVLLILLSSCGSNQKTVTDNAKNQPTQKDSVIRELLLAPPVGTPKWAPNTTSVLVEISSLKRSGGELIMEVLVKKVIGVGASTPMLALNEKINLTYPENGPKQEVVESLMTGDKAEMLLSFTNSITEGSEMWFCERIDSKETQE
jgi:hypothetical protein